MFLVLPAGLYFVVITIAQFLDELQRDRPDEHDV